MPVQAEPTVHGLPPGVDFARELVSGLMARLEGEPPEAMARLRLFVSSGRMQRRVREEFDRQGAGFLPRLHLVSDLARWPMAGLPPAIPPLRRKLELATLVDRMARRLPAFETGTGIFSLADSLGSLMAEMQSEGVAPDALERLDIQASHAEHWHQSLAFIRIVARYFEASAVPDPEGRQRRVAEHLAARWAAMPSDERIVVAGSTGSRGATRVLMRAVALLPRGALVLPGFDFEMPEHAWNSLYSGDIPIEDHPQFRFAALLEELGLAPCDVRRWTEAQPPSPARNALVGLALRPAPVTDQWMREGRDIEDLLPACAEMTLIEARAPRDEALALALLLRDAVERGERAALITPDRTLTRRVEAALDRWGIVPDDSAGQPLQQSAPGRLLRHVARSMGRKPGIETLLILLKHPLAASGSTLRGPHLRLTRELELKLRRDGPAFPDAVALAAWSAAQGPEGQAWAAWLGAIVSRLEEREDRSISAWLQTHLALLEALAAGPAGAVSASELWLQEAGRACQRLLAELRDEAPDEGRISAGNYADLIETLLQAEQLRDPRTVHPQVAFLGTLEARVQDADLVILAGLNEGVWPEAPAPDPWLSRRMRLDSGLLLPERQIGLAAHDFQQAIAARRVVLSRSRRDSEAETVPSRWLNRLTNLMNGLGAQNGPEALSRMRVRGGYWLQLAEALERPAESRPAAPRPAPRPPAEARPRRLPVTAIKTLIRDPYALYAARILRLRPLDPLRPQPDPRLRGDVLHRIVEKFVTGYPDQETPSESAERLLRIAEAILRESIPWPSAQRLWYARLARIAPQLVADEAERRARGVPMVIEERGTCPLDPLAFTLTAKPDRIDLLHDGSAQIFDYKTGIPPSDAEVLYFDKQLLLEAALTARGAFAALGPRTVSAMTYIRLGGTGESRDLRLGPEEIEQSWAKLRRLIERYLSVSQGFTARRALHTTREHSDYDHLSRFGEWDLTDLPKPEDVG